MVVRIWKTAVDEARAGDYERFAEERSLPMFQRRPGCLGVLFGRMEERRAVVSLWTDMAAVAALEADVEYQATVEEILAAGFLRPPQSVEKFEVSGGWLADGVTAPLGEGFRGPPEARATRADDPAG